ncbi:hypothetical protein MMC07_006321 [Pseudocyphellaria aurata]|nr:hypothetical protein [Pseudocyphellaria aurata]
MNDLGFTLSRYLNNIVNDYLSQAAIDYLPGNVTSQIFEEFETELMGGDPAMSITKVRAQAISMSLKIVITEQDEDFVGGWTLLSPQHDKTIRTSAFAFEEVDRGGCGEDIAVSSILKILAFEALPTRSSFVKKEDQETHEDNSIMSEEELVQSISDEINMAATAITTALCGKYKDIATTSGSDNHELKF